MVTIKIILFILLFPVLAFSQMPNEIDSLSLILTERMTMGSTGTGFITTTKLLHELNIGIQKVCEDFPAIEIVDTLFYESDSDGVALATNFDRLLSADRFTGGKKYPLTIIPPELETQVIKTKKDAEVDRQDFTSPKYCHSFAGRFTLSPKYTKNKIDTLIIKYYAKDLWLASGDTTVVKNKYLESIIIYAMSNLWADRGQFTKANYFSQKYLAEKATPPTTRIEEGEK